MTETATIDWFGRLGTSVFSEKHCCIILFIHSLGLRIEALKIDKT